MAKKKFFDVVIGAFGITTSILAFSPQELEGKVIKLDVTRIMRGKNTEAILRIKKEDNQLKTELLGIKIFPQYLQRVIIKGMNYVEDSFFCQCKDAKLRIKPFILTRKKVHRSVRKALRNKNKELIEEFCKDKTAEEIFSAAIIGKMQREFSMKLRKIYPLSFYDIRWIKIE